MVSIGSFQDLTGQKFGRLTVIERAENKKKNVMWKCICDCGGEKIVRADTLKRGICKSCGCLINEYNSTKGKLQLNKYNLSGEYGIGYTTKGEEFYFDLEDYDKIKDYTWHIDSSGYISTSINETHSKLRMHQLIMNTKDIEGIYADHIYHNKNDNRKSQLRLVTPQQNQFNVTKQKNNTSGHTGVYWHKKHEQWEALIQFNGELKYLGLFDDINDAILAREKAEEKYFGEYRNREN